MEPEAPSDPTPSLVPADPVTKDVNSDTALTAVGAEAVSAAVPAEALVQGPPTDDALGPALPSEGLHGADPAEVLTAAVASELPPGTIEFPSIPVRGDDSPAGGGPEAVALRPFDWSQAPAQAAAWPPSLRAAVGIMLASGFPTLIAWGREGTQLYNDACRSVLGATSSQAALGRRASPCWDEIRETLLDPMFQKVMSGAKPIWIEDLILVVDRSGYFEEAYFTFSCSAIRDETGDPIGMLATFVETTARVLGERRLRMLGELAEAATARTADAACRSLAATLETHENDLPFFLLYLLDADGRRARLCASAGVTPDSNASPEMVDMSDAAPGGGIWPVARVARTAQAEVCADLTSLAGSVSGGPWGEGAHTALAVPITHSGQAPAMGVLVAGVSPRRALDGDYRAFLQLVGAQIASAFTHARAYEAERERAEAMAALDRAKTSFFTRVSEEFRTPLTLMLGPAGDLLAGAHGRVSGEQREQLTVLHGNAVHLLKMADTLLAFLRIESGRVEPSFEPTDLPVLTRELASVFRSAVERAGLAFTIDCQPLAGPVYVDRGMWENVVLNLLSNALKFTFDGRIGVALRAADGEVELVVSDTGTGIADEDVPLLFRRFHRVQAPQARTQEGSGLGLALVREFVAIHGGRVSVTTEPGAGTSFTVRLPMGHAHLPPERIVRDGAGRPAAAGAASFVEDVMRWLPGAAAAAVEPPIGLSAFARKPTSNDRGCARSSTTRRCPSASFAVRLTSTNSPTRCMRGWSATAT